MVILIIIHQTTTMSIAIMLTIIVLQQMELKNHWVLQSKHDRHFFNYFTLEYKFQARRA